jgi:hypothetical protein
MGKSANSIVSQAKAWLGCNETDGSHREIIDVYNSQRPLPRGYKVKYTDAWCATFVSAVAVNLGYTDIIPPECSCPKMIELLKNIGAWVEDDAYVPNPGDILFYDWQDTGIGDNRGSSDHVGIVEKVSGNTITIIEGNYSNSVKRRTLEANGRYIRGYGVPKYDTEPVVDKPVTTKTEVCTVEVNVLRKGASGDNVKAMQLLLIGYGYKMQNNGKTYGADGSFGTATDNAVRAFQKNNSLDVDGICGPNTWNKLLGVS